jgi:hypothetical protein
MKILNITNDLLTPRSTFRNRLGHTLLLSPLKILLLKTYINTPILKSLRGWEKNDTVKELYAL